MELSPLNVLVVSLSLAFAPPEPDTSIHPTGESEPAVADEGLSGSASPEDDRKPDKIELITFDSINEITRSLSLNREELRIRCGDEGGIHRARGRLCPSLAWPPEKGTHELTVGLGMTTARGPEPTLTPLLGYQYYFDDSRWTAKRRTFGLGGALGATFYGRDMTGTIVGSPYVTGVASLHMIVRFPLLGLERFVTMKIRNEDEVTFESTLKRSRWSSRGASVFVRAAVDYLPVFVDGVHPAFTTGDVGVHGSVGMSFSSRRFVFGFEAVGGLGIAYGDRLFVGPGEPRNFAPILGGIVHVGYIWGRERPSWKPVVLGDFDQDGFDDEHDRCPYYPGVDVGCAADQDNDQLLDSLDPCPNEEDPSKCLSPRRDVSGRVLVENVLRAPRDRSASVTMENCMPGHEGCVCTMDDRCAPGLDCLDFLCRAPVPYGNGGENGGEDGGRVVFIDRAACAPGSYGCECQAGGVCSDDLQCREDYTRQRSCVAPCDGQRGCACAEGRYCESGSQCSNDVCMPEQQCERGQLGCPCDRGQCSGGSTMYCKTQGRSDAGTCELAQPLKKAKVLVAAAFETSDPFSYKKKKGQKAELPKDARSLYELIRQFVERYGERVDRVFFESKEYDHAYGSGDLRHAADLVLDRGPGCYFVIGHTDNDQPDGSPWDNCTLSRLRASTMAGEIEEANDVLNVDISWTKVSFCSSWPTDLPPRPEDEGEQNYHDRRVDVFRVPCEGDGDITFEEFAERLDTFEEYLYRGR